MKKVYFLLLTILFAATITNAQVANYNFAASSGTYTALVAPTNVFSGAWDDNTAISVPIGFTFTFNGVGYTSVFVHPNGYLTFGSSTSGYVPISGGSAVAGVVSGYGRDLQSQNTVSLGSVDYLSAGGVFTVQWSNTRRYNGTTLNNERFEMQIQLVQTTNVVNFVYGTWSNAVNAANSTLGEVGLRGTSGTDFKNLSVLTGGSWASPAAGAVNTATIFYNESSSPTKPSPGQTYTFTPPPPCVAPAGQATGLVLTAISTSQINGSFSSTAADGYLVVRYPAGSSTTPPVNGTAYVAGTSIGLGKVVSSSALTTFSATGLTPSTNYDFYVYAYNNLACAGAPAYNLSSPTTGSQTTLACTGIPAGTYTVGPTGTYPSLTAVSAALSGGTAGAVIFELQSTYLSTVETFPITFPTAVCTAVGGVTIRPQTGAVALSITSANATGTINFDGGNNITFDGRAGGVGVSQLSISNTVLTGYAIQFINSARFNTIKYCTVSGVNTGTTSGVIFFSNAVGLTTGNSNNTIDNCELRDGATTPTNLVYCSGNTADYASQNNNNTISNNLIHDWFNATATTLSAAINIVSGGSDWTITGNSFYQTATRTFTMTTATDEGAIAITNTLFGTNFTISNNFIGGSAPLCAGTPWTYTASATGLPVGKMIRLTGSIGAYSNITGNTIRNISITSATVNNLSGLISHAGGNVNIANNTLGSQTTTGDVTFTLTNATVGVFFLPIGTGLGAAACNVNITGNNIGGITVSNSSTGSISFRLIYAQPVVGSLFNISNNLVGGTVANSIQQLSNNILHGILFLGASVDNVFSNNTVRNLTQNNAGVTGSVTGVNIQTTGGRSTITGNTIFNLTTNGTNVAINNAASVVGLSMTSPLIGGNIVSGNTIYNLTNTNLTVAGWVNGMSFTAPNAPQPITNVSKNFIHSLNVASSVGAAGMSGIISLTTGPFNVYNNMIRLGVDGSGASITNAIQILGLYKANTGMNAFFNTVYIGGTGVASGTNLTACYAKVSTGATDTIMNNIFYNARSNAAGTAPHYGMYLNNSTTLFSNYNDIFTNGTGGVLGQNNAIDYTTLATWRTATNQDWNSISANPNLANPTGTSVTVDLHIGAGATPIEQAGYSLANITEDFDAQARAGLTPVDIGADAGNFTVSDIAPPVIYLVPLLANACSTGDRVVSGINITDATGVPTTGTLRPRIYYRKGAGSWFSQPGTLTSGTGTNGIWDFNIVAADMGGLIVGDIVSYYIVAQDIVATPNLASNAGGAVSATNDVNNITTHPTTANTFTVTGVSLSGNYNVGIGQTYTTLTAAVTAYNTACLGGPVTFLLTDANYAGETFPITIAANPYASATNTLTIKTTLAATTITGTSATALIVFNGADWVRINGSINATVNTVCPSVAASRDLTLTNTNVSTTSAVVWLQSTATFNGATNNSLINVNLEGSGNAQTFVGVGSGSTTISTASLGVGNDNNSFVNNNVSKTQYGIFSQGQSLGQKNVGTVINQNLVNTVAPNNTARGGILVGFENGISISGNKISEIALASSPDVFGIALGGIAITTTGFTGNEVINATVTKNIIGSVRNTGNSFSACGIFLATALSGTNTISNNMISGVSGNPTPGDLSVGILVGGGNGSVTRLYNNTVTMTNVNPLASSTSPSYALAVGGTTPNPVVDIRNNILVNYQNNGSGNNYAIGYGYTPHTNVTSDHNDYYVAAGATFFIGATGSLSAPTNQATVAALQAATLKDGNAINLLPTFVSATDLHLTTAAANWCLNGTGTAVSVTDDIDCQVRNNPPDIGADEFVGTAPVATISYAGSPYCSNAGTATVTQTGTPGGTYSSTAGLTINAATGDVTLGTSTPGTYTVTYSFSAGGGCALLTTTASITITAPPSATISYAGSPYCANAGTATVTQSGTTGGTYSSTAGLTINAATGAVTLGTSTPGSYTVTYTIAASGGCALYTTTASITITAVPAATISYTGSPYCSNAGTATVTLTGTSGGTYSSTAGLTINAATGDVTLGTSTAGTYTVTYTIAASGGCALFTTTTTITITTAPAATIAYAGSPYCTVGGTATVTQTGTAGGTYSSTAGLTINAANGDVTLATSTPGTYTVTYSIAASGGCPLYT
ncbi:MAG: hypothetical protein ABIO79_12470, partial [Ferruginibacter sp.]